MRHVLNHVNTGSNVISPMELYTALQTNGGVGNTVAAMFDLDRQFIEEFTKKYATALEFFANIKRCNEIIFSANSILVYEYSGINAITIDMSDPSNPIGQLPDNDQNEDIDEDSDAGDNDEETAGDSNGVVDDLGEEEE